MNNGLPKNQIIYMKQINAQKDKLPKLAQGEIGNLNRTLTSTETELLIKYSPQRTTQAQVAAFMYIAALKFDNFKNNKNFCNKFNEKCE